jgi:ParB family chromosome partitioning protein
MRLGNVSPRLLADYRADTVTLDQLMALALTDDHEAQEAASMMHGMKKGDLSTFIERAVQKEILTPTAAQVK